MSFSQESGYVPVDIETIMLSFMTNINTQFGTTYTTDSFQGTNMYKYFYAMAQRLQENEVKTSEIFLKLQQYFDITNERISRPVVTNPGLIEKFLDEGYIASVKPMIEADAGKINISVKVDDGTHAAGNLTITNFANLISGTDDSVTIGVTVFTAQSGGATPGAGTFQATTSNAVTATSLAAQINSHAATNAQVIARAYGAVVSLTAIYGGTGGNAIALTYTDNDTNIGATVSGAMLTGGITNASYNDIKHEVCTIIKDSTVAGAVTQGNVSESIVLSNGQSFDFKFWLPDLIPVNLRLTIIVSENNQSVILSPDDTKELLLANIAAKYSLGKNFEPQRYFSLMDAPWAGQVNLEWSIDGGTTYSDDIYDAQFDELFTFDLEDIELVEI